VQATPNTAASGGVSSFLNLDVDYEEIMPFARGLVVEDWLRRHDLKRARAVVSAWENQAPDYPELFYWKWQISRQGSSVGDRAWALKYVRACQELSPRKRKADLLDVELCKAKDVAEADLKALEPQSAPVAKGVKADD
jgi:hypothetical protein